MVTTIQGVELPVVLTPEKAWSDDDLYRFCRENDDLQVERSAKGEIMLISPNGSASGGSNADLTTELSLWTRKDGRGKCFDSSTGWTLPDGSMLSPDASWVPLERWNALTRDERRRFAPLCPEFVVELKSPPDSLVTLREKMGAWLANGAQLAWLIDPDERTVEIFRPAQPPELLRNLDRLTADRSVSGFDLDLTLLWSE